MFKIILLLCLILPSVLTDEIRILEPPSGISYHLQDIINIRYAVHLMGMTKIWSTSAKLTRVETNQVVNSFPSIERVYNDITNYTVEEKWQIPKDIALGEYKLVISANSTAMCSKNNDGRAPFHRCSQILYKDVTFNINEGIIV